MAADTNETTMWDKTSSPFRLHVPGEGRRPSAPPRRRWVKAADGRWYDEEALLAQGEQERHLGRLVLDR